jgi:hypothetical protein
MATSIQSRMEVARRKGMTGRYLGDAAKLRRAMGSS